MVELTIGRRTLGPNHPTYVIAEIGSNHDGSLSKAQDLIRAAAEAGADAVKFQSLRHDKVNLPGAHDEAYVDFFKKIELPESWYPKLADAAAQVGVDWFSSVTYLDAVALVTKHGAPAIKIASAQFDTYPEVVARAAATGLPLIMSCGLAGVGGIDRMLRLARSEGNDKIVLLHCVSEYPADADSINLRVMESHRQMFGCLVGYSDHTLGTDVSIAAVALGAVVIEKHFTLDRGGSGPDHFFATEPDEFARMVSGIRTVERARGDGVARPLSPAAEDLRAAVQYKWVANAPIAADQRLNREDFVLRRLPGGIERDAIDVVERAVATRALQPGQPLEWSDLRFAD